jgi:hypothetical protein
MARPRKIDSKASALIADLRARGASQTAVVRALKKRGVKICRRTLVSHLAETVPLAPRPGKRRKAAPAPAETAPAPAALSEGAVAAALSRDDLGQLAALGELAHRAMSTWGDEIGYNPVAARTFAQLGKYHADVSARLIQLRPRADAEAERFAELGEERRTALLERARQNTTPDLRARLARAEHLLGLAPESAQ